MKNITFIFLCSIFSTGYVYSETAEKPSFWESSLSKEAQQTEFNLVGRATFSYLLWDIYTSQLSTSSGEFDLTENQPVLYSIQYLRDIKAKDLLDETEKQWQHIGIKKSIYSPYLMALQKMWPDINEGDSLTFIKKDNRSVFYYNDEFIGQIDDQAFANHFLSIWLSKKTSEPSLRKQLLGQ